MKGWLQKIMYSLGLFLFFFVRTSQASFGEVVEVEGFTLIKRSEAPAYYKRIIKLYDAALYTNANLALEELQGSTVAVCLVLKYRQKISKSAFVQASEKIMRRQLGEEKFQEVRVNLASLNMAFKDVSPGDDYRFCRLPDGLVQLYYQGQLSVSIKDETFGIHYMNIWLGENGISQRLRRRLSRFD